MYGNYRDSEESGDLFGFFPTCLPRARKMKINVEPDFPGQHFPDQRSADQPFGQGEN
jgi:hypothetical protein